MLHNTCRDTAAFTLSMLYPAATRALCALSQSKLFISGKTSTGYASHHSLILCRASSLRSISSRCRSTRASRACMSYRACAMKSASWSLPIFHVTPFDNLTPLYLFLSCFHSHGVALSHRCRIACNSSRVTAAPPSAPQTQIAHLNLFPIHVRKARPRYNLYR